MLRRIVLAGLMAVSLVAVPVVVGPAAAASRPQPVSIVSNMVMADPWNYGDFAASGSDLICAYGVVNDTRIVWGVPRSYHARFPVGGQLVVDKTFTCGDGSGQIFFRLQIHGLWATETFTWVILGGTGEYANLNGQGSGTTDYNIVDDTLISTTNYYSGALVG
jgi:hypothetical protein